MFALPRGQKAHSGCTIPEGKVRVVFCQPGDTGPHSGSGSKHPDLAEQRDLEKASLGKTY